MATTSVPASISSTDTIPTLEKAVEPPLHTIPSRISRAQSRTEQGDVEKDEEPAADDEEPIRTITGLKWVLVCASLYVSAFLYGLDTTIAADVQGPVIDTFGHVEQLAWVGAGFPMGSVSVILFLSGILNSFNMKWIYVSSVVVFEAGSAICGAAPNMSALIVGRVIAGAGGSGIYLGCLNYFSSLTRPTERGTYISLIAFCWGLGAVLGPLIGGAFSVSTATWRWAFYINLVVGAVVSPVFLLFLPSIHPVQGVSIRARLAKLDFIGFILNAGVWTSFTIALIMAGGQWKEWNDGRTIAIFVVFGVLLIIYIIQQYFTIFTTKDTRAFPAHLLRSPTQILLYIATSGNVTTLFVVVYFVPIYFQFVHDDSAIMAAVRLLPYVVITCTVNVCAGHLLSKIKMYMPIYVFSGILLTLGGSLLMVYLDPSTSQGTIYGLTVVIAIGTGLTLQIGYAIATFDAPDEDMGDAISLQNVAQIGSSVIALVIAGQVFQSSAVSNLEAVLAGKGFSEADIIGAVAGAQSTLFQELSGDLKQAAILAITQAMQKAFSLNIVAGGVLLLAGLAMKRERLFGEVIVA